jgi:heme O synthase-like polyprenyltransferase
VRITTVTGKIIYIVGVFALILVLNVFLFARFLNPTFDVLVVAILNVAYVVVGVRTFRGADENRTDPRPWWRATARPAAGFWIGGLLAVLAFISGVGAFGSDPENAFIPAVACLSYALLATFYLHSSVRLQGMDTAG